MEQTFGHILIVEDDPLLQQQIAEILSFEGYSITIAQNGNEGIEKAIALLPDLILSDISMPDCNGFEFLEKLQTNSKTAIIPFLFLTANSDLESVKTGKRLGADDYLLKPFDQEELLVSVKNRLEKSLKTKSVVTKEASKQIEQIRYTVSTAMPHEFRTPLSSILGISELLRDRAKQYKPSKISEYSEMIFDAGKRLERLLENYVLYTQLSIQEVETPQRKKEPSIWDRTESIEFELEEIIEKVAKPYERIKDIEVSVSETPIAVNPELFRKITFEILDNALKFSEVGTKISVESIVKDTFLYLSIKDNGIGMSKVEVEKIGAFVQHNRDNQEQQGGGLGLTVAHLLASRNACAISIVSQIGSHTVVTIKFPIDFDNEGD